VGRPFEFHDRSGRRGLSAPIVVAGGGAIGLSIAWRCAERGLDVVVIDEQPGRAASWAAAGMLAPVAEVHFGEEALLRLNLEASNSYPDWVAELESFSGVDTGYRRSGTVMVARDNDDNAALEEIYGYQLKLGLDVKRLKSTECRRLEPALAPGVRGGVLVEGDHQIDNRALIAALLEACRKANVRVVKGVVQEVTGTAHADGVRLSDGAHVEASQVVVATGAWTNRIGGLGSGRLPDVRPVKGQLLHLRTRGRDSIPQRTVRGIDVYVVPREDGRVVVGATVEEQGFDTTVTAGATLDLLRYAYELLPGIAEYELTEVACGLRPATIDNQPVIGPTGVRGLCMATGHFRNGILLAPLTADLMGHYLDGGDVPELMEPFLPTRFQRAGRAAS
jgi:glycine oxidase